MKRAVGIILLGMMLIAGLSIAVAGEPSANNPKRQDAFWAEQDLVYNMTYLANGNVTVIIQPPDIFEFEGNGTVVIWLTATDESGNVTKYQHLVLKIRDGEAVREHMNEINGNPMAKGLCNDTDNEDHDDEDLDIDEDVKEIKSSACSKGARGNRI